MTIVGKTNQSARFRRSRWLMTLLLGLYFVYTFVPIWYVITSSTKTNPDLFTSFGLWFASDFHLWQNLYDLSTIQHGIFRIWLGNTFYYSLVSGLGAAVFATMAGYAFAKYEFFGKKFVFALVLGAVMIPQTALVIPIFQFCVTRTSPLKLRVCVFCKSCLVLLKLMLWYTFRFHGNFFWVVSAAFCTPCSAPFVKSGCFFFFMASTTLELKDAFNAMFPDTNLTSLPLVLIAYCLIRVFVTGSKA